MSDARIFEDLKADHDRHREMLAKLSNTPTDSDKRSTLFEELRLELQAHAAAEEESLYATMLGKPDLRDDARHSVSEHKEVDDYLSELLKLDIKSDEWTATFEKMQHRYLHHIDEEEEDMFPAASKGLNDIEEARLANIFEDRKPKELEIAAEDKPGDERD
jgi:hemerythrin superfamily protein